MARETRPAMLMITSPPAPELASSVTSAWRLSCQRPKTFALSRTEDACPAPKVNVVVLSHPAATTLILAPMPSRLLFVPRSANSSR